MFASWLRVAMGLTKPASSSLDAFMKTRLVCHAGQDLTNVTRLEMIFHDWRFYNRMNFRMSD